MRAGDGAGIGGVNSLDRFTTMAVSPGEIRMGDHLVDDREWIVISGPWKMRVARMVYLFAQDARQPQRRREFAWYEDEPVTVWRED